MRKGTLVLKVDVSKIGDEQKDELVCALVAQLEDVCTSADDGHRPITYTLEEES